VDDNFRLLLFSSILIIWITLIIFFVDDITDYDVDSARYTHSAIFQGFAALVGISVTASLITLHFTFNSITGMEERIYKIIGKRAPDNHIPMPLEMEVHYITSGLFFSDLLKSSFKENLDHRQRRGAARVLSREVYDLFAKIKQYKQNSIALKQSFKISLPILIFIILLSLIALVFFTPDQDNSESGIILISQKVLYVIFGITVYSILSLGYLFHRVIVQWNRT